MSPDTRAWLRLTALLVLILFVQATFAPDVRIGGVAPDLLTLLAICAGLVGGPAQGAVVGFAAGVLADMLLIVTPVGLSALTLCLIGAGVGALRTAVLREGWAVTPAVAFVATAAAVALFLGLSALVGQSQLLGEGRGWMLRVALVESVYAAVLSIPVARLVRWAAAGSTGKLDVDGIVR